MHMIKRQLIKSFAMLALFLPGQYALAQGQAPESIFWEISGNGLKKSSYLLGTYHALPWSYTDNWPKLLQKLAQSEQLVVEAVIDSSQMMRMASHFVMDGQTLNELFEPADLALVEAAAKRHMGLTLEQVQQFKPIFIMMNMVMAEVDSAQKLMEIDQYDGAPLDLALANLFMEFEKPVIPLETMEDQMKMLYGHYDNHKQAEMLLEMLHDPRKSFEMQEKMIQAYLSGSLSELMELYVATNTEGEDFAFLLDDRNVAWMEVLPKVMQEARTFIAVGAMHLPGELGLLQLLKEAGYTLKPLPLK
jgi:uncharacterized protein YbaP (TraB family)